MTPIRTMAELHDAGIRVQLDGDRLLLDPVHGPLPPALHWRVADGERELVALLASAEGRALCTLLDLAIDEDVPGATVVGLSMRDLRACAGLPRSALAAFLRALARSQRMAAGRVPAGWTRVAECDGCGVVLLWPGAPAAVRTCPWCRHRRAGRTLPRPRPSRPRAPRQRNPARRTT